MINEFWRKMLNFFFIIVVRQKIWSCLQRDYKVEWYGRYGKGRRKDKNIPLVTFRKDGETDEN